MLQRNFLFLNFGQNLVKIEKLGFLTQIVTFGDQQKQYFDGVLSHEEMAQLLFACFSSQIVARAEHVPEVFFHFLAYLVHIQILVIEAVVSLGVVVWLVVDEFWGLST
jgi:hypothetical protein